MHNPYVPIPYTCFIFSSISGPIIVENVGKIPVENFTMTLLSTFSAGKTVIYLLAHISMISFHLFIVWWFSLMLIVFMKYIKLGKLGSLSMLIICCNEDPSLQIKSFVRVTFRGVSTQLNSYLKTVLLNLNNIN